MTSTSIDTERLDVLTPEGTPTGLRKPRGEVHRDGDWHRTLHVWIVREERYVLFQRRALSKQVEPGKIDVAVGGHVRAGETPLDTLREADEELGIQVSPERLEPLGVFPVERNYPDLTDREFETSYLLRDDRPLGAYLPNPAEVSVLYEVPLEGAIHLHRDGTPTAAAGYDCYGRRNNALLIESDLIAQARGDIVARLEQIGRLLQTV